MRYLLCALIVIANVWAQETAPKRVAAAEVRVVRVERGYVCGFCGGLGYRGSHIIVQPSRMIQISEYSSDERKLPNRKEKFAITRGEWHTLVHSIDADALRALPEDKTCRPCIDQPDSWLEIDYSDGSKLVVHYYPGSEPGPVKAVKFPGPSDVR